MSAPIQIEGPYRSARRPWLRGALWVAALVLVVAPFIAGLITGAQ